MPGLAPPVMYSTPSITIGVASNLLFTPVWNVHCAASRSTLSVAISVSVPGMLGVLSAIVGVPILMGLGAKWSAGAEIAELRGANTALQVENGSYRAATGELTTQIQSLEDVINDLGARSRLDPAQVK